MSQGFASVWIMRRQPLPQVTTSDLSRQPGDVLDRVARGERLVVCRRKEPVATLQPLDGYVFQPFTGTAHDIFGWPFGAEADQLEGLSDVDRALLLDGCRGLRVRTTVHLDEEFGWSVLRRAIEAMRLRGLARKTPRGIELTGRGLFLREVLMKLEGREAELGA